MPAFAVFASVGAFLFARRPRFGATARAEDYFCFEVVAVPNFPGFGASGELVLLWFLLVVLHWAVKPPHWRESSCELLLVL